MLPGILPGIVQDIPLQLTQGWFSLGIEQYSMRRRERKELFPGALEMMILQTLQHQPLHGYALVQHIKQTSNGLLQVEEGSLYPALQRMLKDGLVKAKWSLSSTGRRVRVYDLTPAGLKHLEHEVSSFEQMLEGIRLVLRPVRP
jgi:PadR family transcriptional regulator, regulatory protein PadR